MDGSRKGGGGGGKGGGEGERGGGNSKEKPENSRHPWQQLMTLPWKPLSMYPAQTIPVQFHAYGLLKLLLVVLLTFFLVRCLEV